jgi:hypothetical protein
MQPPAAFEAARALSEVGWSDYAVARRTGVPRSTVARWRLGGFVRITPVPTTWAWTPAHPWYAYILGLYLGDGCLYWAGRAVTPTLDIACDARYPAIVAEAERALRGVLTGAPVRRFSPSQSACVHLRITHGALPLVFPQHGPGPKHERRIELTAWQRALSYRAPAALLRGLIHSDGSRCINRFDTKLLSGRVAHYEYVRYFFTNYSSDIRRIFCEHCELLGIRWTQSNPRNISISHRDSVAILDEIVGPKS